MSLFFIIYNSCNVIYEAYLHVSFAQFKRKGSQIQEDIDYLLRKATAFKLISHKSII